MIKTWGQVFRCKSSESLGLLRPLAYRPPLSLRTQALPLDFSYGLEFEVTSVLPQIPYSIVSILSIAATGGGEET